MILIKRIRPRSKVQKHADENNWIGGYKHIGKYQKDGMNPNEGWSDPN